MNETLLIVLLVICICMIFFLISFMFIRKINKKNKQEIKKITSSNEKVYLSQGIEYAVKETGIKEGKYLILESGLKSKHINFRITGFIKEFKIGQSINLREGEKITALSSGVYIVRRSKQ